MFEYTSQVIAREREAEIVRAAEQRRAGLERLAASTAPDAPSAHAGSRAHGSAPAGEPLRALRSALRRALRSTSRTSLHSPGPVSVDRGTMAG